ncbi:MAG: TonB-dependent receptor [Bryobacterales bacterium]|nr:TonB-dependent receptor [Bryobacterales bacterium]
MKRLILLALSFALSLAAQSVTGTLVGTASDAGGVVPGAQVTITNQGTSVTWKVTTNQTGDYVAPNLPAGVYEVRAEHPGYRAVTIRDIKLALNGTVRNDIRFEPGEVKQTVEVTATAPVVQSETSSVANTIDTEALTSLPVNGRMIDTFILTTAGNTGDSASNPKIGGAAHWGATTFTVNGVTTNDLGNGGGSYSFATAMATQPSLDTIQEFKVESNAASAEFGGSVAVSILTKSGTNEFHGSLYAYNRNRQLAANQFFSNSAGKMKPPYNRNEFGVSAGGPVVKGHTFFFLSYDGLRLRNSNPGTFSVPINAIRQGDFSTYPAVKDPAAAGAPFSNNQVPASRIDPRAAKMISFIPAPNLPGKTYNYAETLANVIDTNRASARIDHNFNSMNMLSASLNWSKGDPYSVNQYSPMAYGNYSNAGFMTKSAALTYTRILSPSMTNELRGSYYAMESVRMGQNQDFNPASLFPDLFAPLPRGGLPTFNMTGFTKVGDSGGADPQPQITDQIGDTFSWVHGSHITKAGVDVAVSRVSTNPSVTAAVLGTFGFNGRYTGNAFGDVLLGFPYTATRATPTPANVIGQQRWGAYIQDDWKVSPRLTLNIGMRYELQTQMSERTDSWTNVDLATGQLVIASANGNYSPSANQTLLGIYPSVKSEDHGWGTDVTLPDHRDFAPRVGFAFRPFHDNKTVIRGGYGLFFYLIPIYQGIYQLGISNPPFRLVQAFTGGATAPTISLASPFSVTPVVSANPALYAVNRQIRNPYSQQWNLTVEHQLPGDFGVRVSYVGNKVTRSSFVNYNLNQPVTQRAGELQAMRPFQPWSDIYAMMQTGNAFTNQLQVEVTRRFSKGFFLDSSFTWNRSLDNVPVSGTPQNPYDASADRGNADGIRRLVSYTSVSYELPFGQGQRFNPGLPVVSTLASGWRVSSITQFRSGGPFTVGFSPALSGWYASRANVVSSNLYPASQTINNWFNASAFAIPGNYTFGNSARNMLFGPGQKIFDVSVAKSTAINDRIKTELRADFFNMPNTPSFANPASNITVPSTVGVITGTTVDARTIQIGMRVSF